MGRVRIFIFLAPSMACALFPDLSGLDEDAATTTDASIDATVDASIDVSVDAQNDAIADAKVEAGFCYDGGVELLVSTTHFCIDATEVTVGAYTTFLASKAGDTSGQPPYCAFNTNYVPGNWPQATTNAAVVRVDQCDAIAYCTWAGKRLCGDIKGGHAAPGSVADPTHDQWFFACSHNNDGAHQYPYGNTYQATTCNGKDRDAGGVIAVGSLTSCVGGFPGVFDLSGNAWEWEDSCNTYDAGGTDVCVFRGGAYTTDSANLLCAGNTFFGSRNGAYQDVGFRCCSL